MTDVDDRPPLRLIKDDPAADNTSDTSYEVALDGDDADDAELVDQDAGLVLEDDGEELPIIPHHLRTARGVRDAVVRRVDRTVHLTGFHVVRTPKYAALACLWSVVGVFRLAGRQARWAWLSEQEILRLAAVADADSREWLRLHREAKTTRRARGIMLGLEAFAAVLLLVVVSGGPWWAWPALVAAAVPMLARFGRPDDRPIITSARTHPRHRVINADVVIRAYTVAGLCDPAKEGRSLTFGAPMSADGPGSRVVIDLPYGGHFADVVKARPEIASGLDVAMSQVYVTRNDTSERRHVLWVAYRDPLAAPPVRTPLLACKPTDIWQPVPLGPDERGRPITVDLMWNSVLVGGVARMGKSFSARHIGLHVALDPYVQLHVFDAGGKPDWRMFSLVAEDYAFGLMHTSAGDPAEILLGTLRRLKADVESRYDRLSKLPVDVCPEGKLTRDIARNPKYRMPVRVVILDEFQEYFGLGEMSKEIAELLVYLTRVAPAAGVIVISATQKPSGVGGSGNLATQFTTMRDMHQIRASLRTTSYTMSETVLGQGALSEGLDSSTLLPQHKGVFILRGATDASPTVRSYYAKGTDAEKILTAARKHREAAGTLCGMAVGEEPDEQPRNVLADVLAVFGEDRGLHWSVLAERLAARFPDRWADADKEAVSAQCRALGVPSVPVRWPSTREGKVLDGCRWDAVKAVFGDPR